MYLQNFKVWKLTEPELQAFFHDYSKQEITFAESLNVRSRTFCQGKNADIQDYAPARNVTDVVIFKMSKDCRSELAIFERKTPLVEAGKALLISCPVKGGS